jgi:hypothetical protein
MAIKRLEKGSRAAPGLGRLGMIEEGLENGRDLSVQ